MLTLSMIHAPHFYFTLYWLYDVMITSNISVITCAKKEPNSFSLYSTESSLIQ
jgi:hypothetical protein